MGEGKVGWEIERRYLVRVEAAVWERLGEGEEYRQGYVKTGDPSVRVRVGEPRGAVLTLKRGKGVRRREVETTIPDPVARELLAAAGRRVLDKTRWRIGPWELDRFGGELEGLTLLEIELADEDQEVPGPPEGVSILREVTDDKRFTSSALARMKRKEQARWVRKVYEEVSG